SSFRATPRFQERLLIKPRMGVPPEEVERLHLRTGCEHLRTFSGLGGLELLRVPFGRNTSQVILDFCSSGLIEYAEPDYRVHLASAFPNDPKLLDGTLWALNNAGQDAGKPNADIDAPEAWGLWHAASNVVVAVVDSGVRS